MRPPQDEWGHCTLGMMSSLGFITTQQNKTQLPWSRNCEPLLIVTSERRICFSQPQLRFSWTKMCFFSHGLVMIGSNEGTLI